MSTAVLRAVRKRVYDFDSRGRAEHRETTARVHRMTAQGVSADEVGTRVGMSGRNVERVKARPFPAQPQHITPNVSVQREAELEDVALLASQLAASLRDEDPLICWGVLCALSARQLRELCVTALAMVPVDESLSTLLGWVAALPTAQEDSR